MREESLINIEEKLSQLVSLVGNQNKAIQGIKSEMQEMKSDMQEMKQDMQEMKSDMQEMTTDIQGLKTDMQETKTEINDMKHEMQIIKYDQQQERIKNDNRHKEVLSKFAELKLDQDFIWEKAVRNEREIAMLKSK